MDSSARPACSQSRPLRDFSRFPVKSAMKSLVNIGHWGRITAATKACFLTMVSIFDPYRGNYFMCIVSAIDTATHKRHGIYWSSTPDPINYILLHVLCF